jgi:DNA-binding HxlR family transcriptional regulator
MRLCRGVEITPECAWLHVCDPLPGIDLDLAKPGKVDNDSVVAERRARHVMAATADADWQTILAGKGQRSSCVFARRALSDQQRAAIDRIVPDAPGGIVFRLLRSDQATGKAGDRGGGEHGVSLANGTLNSKDKKSTCVSIQPCHTERMAEYNQYCPIARGAEIFAERWTPLIIRNLMLGCHSFNAIAEGVPRMSRTLLTRRLRELSRMGVVEMRPNPAGRGHLYFLTPAGQELKGVTMALGAWGARWIELGPADYDAGVVLWAICRLASPDSLPRQRHTVRFEISGRKREQYWVIFQRPEAEVCLKPPGFDEDLVVTTTAEWLTKWHAGLISWQEALRRDLIRLDGTSAVAQALPRWAPLSAFARIRPVTTG